MTTEPFALPTPPYGVFHPASQPLQRATMTTPVRRPVRHRRKGRARVTPRWFTGLSRVGRFVAVTAGVLALAFAGLALTLPGW